MSNLHWTMGQLLLPEHFKYLQEQVLKQQINSQYPGITRGQFGFIALLVDPKELMRNLFKLEQFEYIMPCGQHLSLSYNALIRPLELSRDNEDQSDLTVYFYVAEDKITDQKIFNGQTVELEFFDIVLTCDVHESAHCPELVRLRRDGAGVYQVLPDIPEHCLMVPQQFSQRLLQVVSGYLELMEDKVIHHNAIAAVNRERYLIKHKELVVRVGVFALDISSHDPHQFAVLFYDIYLFSCMVFEVDPEMVSFDSGLISIIKTTIDKINDIFSGRVLSKPKTFLLNYRDGLHQSGILPVKFLSPGRKYLLLTLKDHCRSINQLQVKAFAPGRTKAILLQALTGVKLEKIPDSDREAMFSNANFVYEITDNGSEWSYVEKERNLIVKALGVDQHALDCTLALGD